MANRVSSDQLEALLKFLAQHPALAKCIGLGAGSREIVDRQWNDLASRLNALGSGSTKTGERWRRNIQPEVAVSPPVQPEHIVAEEVVRWVRLEQPKRLT